MSEAIAGMKSAFVQLSTGQASMPLRSRTQVDSVQGQPVNGTTLVMPAFLPESSALGIKIVSVFPQNVARGLPLIHALVLALDAETGRPLALLEGGSVTAIRTGAGSGAATDVLARPAASIAAVIGSGVQARTQLEAICTVRSVEEVRVFSLSPANAEAFAAEMAGLGPIPQRVVVVDDPDTAVADADIICAATTSETPVFDGTHLKPGAHVNAVGSYMPSMQEVDVATIRRALVVVDSREAVLAEAGDLLVPLEQGDISADHIHAELGEIIVGKKHGRTTPDQITYFKSVGVAVQDAAAARIALQNALAHNLGQIVEL